MLFRGQVHGVGQVVGDVQLHVWERGHGQSHPSGPGRFFSAFNPISARVSSECR